MLKYFYHSFVALLLVLAVLGPTVLSFYSTDGDTYVMELSGEESNEQEAEKTLDKKELFFEWWKEDANLCGCNAPTINTPYQLIAVNFTLEIVLPPPKGNV